MAFVGAVSSEEGALDITVLGDTVNIAARLVSNAKQGEILISDAAYAEAGLPEEGLEKHTLDLKGKNEPVTVFALTNLDLSIVAQADSPL
jgi:class 3 adenylate cyclase